MKFFFTLIAPEIVSLKIAAHLFLKVSGRIRLISSKFISKQTFKSYKTDRNSLNKSYFKHILLLQRFVLRI